MKIYLNYVYQTEYEFRKLMQEKKPCPTAYSLVDHYSMFVNHNFFFIMNEISKILKTKYKFYSDLLVLFLRRGFPV